MLEDLVLAALHDVNARLAEIQRAAHGPARRPVRLGGGSGATRRSDDRRGRRLPAAPSRT